MTGLSIETMLDVVEKKFQVPAQEIASDNDSRAVQEARNAFIYLATRLVHASCMNGVREENPDALRRAGFAVMRHFEKEIIAELCELFNTDYKTVRGFDNEAIRLREESKEYYEKTEAIWAELDEAYELGMANSPVIWIDRTGVSSSENKKEPEQES